MSRKDIKEHDRVLIEHKLYEMKLNKNMILSDQSGTYGRKYAGSLYSRYAGAFPE